MWNDPTSLKSLANVLLIGAAMVLVYAFGFWLTHALVFPVKKIEIHGQLRRVTPEQLKFIAEHELSGTFFTLDIDKTRAAFSRLPWVKEAQVRRRWPDTLDIEVDEHIAIARWHENGLVGSDGEWFDAASDQELPVLIGPAGSEKEMSQMLLRFRRELAATRLAVVRMWLSERRAWQVALDNGVRLELGRGEVENRAARFAAHWNGTLAALPYLIEYVDMRYPNGFAVRLSALNISALKKT